MSAPAPLEGPPAVDAKGLGSLDALLRTSGPKLWRKEAGELVTLDVSVMFPLSNVPDAAVAPLDPSAAASNWLALLVFSWSRVLD